MGSRGTCTTGNGLLESFSAVAFWCRLKQGKQKRKSAHVAEKRMGNIEKVQEHERKVILDDSKGKGNGGGRGCMSRSEGERIAVIKVACVARMVQMEIGRERERARARERERSTLYL